MKTYLPALVKILLKVCGYIRRWYPQLAENLGEGGAAALDAVVLACTALEALATAAMPPEV